RSNSDSQRHGFGRGGESNQGFAGSGPPQRGGEDALAGKAQGGFERATSRSRSPRTRQSRGENQGIAEGERIAQSGPGRSPDQRAQSRPGRLRTDSPGPCRSQQKSCAT